MADTEVERLVVTLDGDSSGYDRMLRNAQSSLTSALGNIAKSTGNMVANVMFNVGSSIGSILTGSLSGAIGSAFSALGNVLSLAASVVAEASKLIVMSVTGVIMSLNMLSHQMVDNDAAARRMGLSILDVNAAALWSGASARSVSSALGTLQGKLYDAGRGGRMASEDMRSLALSAGVAVETLQGADWTKVMDTIAAIEDPTLRAAQAYRFLGASAGDFLLKLDQGGGAGASKEAAARMGLGAGPGDVQQAAQIAETFRTMGAMLQGVMNQIMLGLAPIFAELSRSFKMGVIDVRGIRDIVFDIAKGAAMVGAFFYNAFTGNTQALKTMVMAMETGVQYIGQVIVDTLGSAFKAAFVIAANALHEYSLGLRMVLDPLNANKELQAKFAEQDRQRQLGVDKQQVRIVRGFIDKAADLESSGSLADYKTASEKALKSFDAARSQGTFGGMMVGKGDQDKLRSLLEEGKMTAARNMMNALLPQEGKSGGSSIFSTMMDAIKSTSSVTSVEDFFDRAKKSVEKLNGTMRESVSGMKQMEIQGRFDQMRQGVQSTIDIFNRNKLDLQSFMRLPGFEDDKALIAFKMLNDLRSGAGVSALPNLAGVAEDKTKEAYSAAAQYELINQRNNVEQQLLVATHLANMQRAAAVANGEKMIRLLELQAPKGRNSSVRSGWMFNP